MKRIVIAFFIFLFLFLPITVTGEGIEEKIIKETELEKAKDIIPETLKNKTDVDFSPTKTPSENGLDPVSVINTIKPFLLKGIKEEAEFVLILISVLLLYKIALSFIEDNTTFQNAARLSISAVMVTLLINHIENALIHVTAYTEELSVFLTGLIPFLGSVSLASGEVSSSVVQSGILMFSVSMTETLFSFLVLPTLKIVLSLTVVGYVSGLSFSALSNIFLTFSQKVITISCGIMCIILYFQKSVSAVSDSLALRSLKLATGNLVPIIGSFVSEASATLVSGVKLVKATFGVFAIAVLLYMTLSPLVAFLIKKLSLRILSAIAKLIACDKEGVLFSEVAGIYNVLSAVMIATSCFFIFALAVFIKSEVG